MTGQRQSSSQKGDIPAGLLTGVVLVLSLVCAGLWGLALYRSGYLATIFPSTAAPASADASLSCKDLIDHAMRASGTYCDKIGPNQVCYGNFTISAELAPEANQTFATAGDTVDIQMLQKLTTAPLNLQNNEWGIAIFNIIANLPRSLPGESVKMVVFGNTTLGNNHLEEMQSFYFSSELGQIVCDEVPFDGLMITMPDGTGVRFMINGSELTLMGNASLTAIKNGAMDVSLYSGTASITANGQTTNFSAGEKVQVPMGGPNGTDPIGPPSQPTPMPPGDNICSIPGMCVPTALPTALPTIAATTTPLPTTALGLTPSVQPTNQPGIIATSTSRPANTVVPPTAQPTTPPQNTVKPPENTPDNDPKKTPPGLEKKTPRPKPKQ